MKINKRDLERLSSNWMYCSSVSAISLVGALTYAFLDHGDNEGKTNLIEAVGVAVILCVYVVWFISTARRIYYKDSCLYIFGMFSNRGLMLKKNI